MLRLGEGLEVEKIRKTAILSKQQNNDKDNPNMLRTNIKY